MHSRYFYCPTRPHLNIEQIQKAIDEFLRAPARAVAQLEWSVHFWAPPKEVRRIVDALLAFSGLAWDGYPVDAPRTAFPPPPNPKLEAAVAALCAEIGKRKAA